MSFIVNYSKMSLKVVIFILLNIFVHYIYCIYKQLFWLRHHFLNLLIFFIELVAMHSGIVYSTALDSGQKSVKGSRQHNIAH